MKIRKYEKPWTKKELRHLFAGDVFEFNGSTFILLQKTESTNCGDLPVFDTELNKLGTLPAYTLVVFKKSYLYIYK